MSAPKVDIALRRDVPVADVLVGAGVHGNALSSRDWVALEHGFRDLAGHDDLSAVLVKGAGKTFSAGSDMREWVGANPEDIDASFGRMESALRAIEELAVPVIAQVNGVAIGAGCQLALACDLQVLADTARIGMPIARLGVLVSASFAHRLAMLAGPGTARELLYTGRLVTAADAVRLGLATRCVLEADLESATEELLAATVSQPAAALRAAKRAVTAGLEPARGAARSTDPKPTVAYDEFQRGVTAFFARKDS